MVVVGSHQPPPIDLRLVGQQRSKRQHKKKIIVGPKTILPSAMDQKVAVELSGTPESTPTPNSSKKGNRKKKKKKKKATDGGSADGGGGTQPPKTSAPKKIKAPKKPRRRPIIPAPDCGLADLEMIKFINSFNSEQLKRWSKDEQFFNDKKDELLALKTPSDAEFRRIGKILLKSVSVVRDLCSMELKHAKVSAPRASFKLGEKKSADEKQLVGIFVQFPAPKHILSALNEAYRVGSFARLSLDTAKQQQQQQRPRPLRDAPDDSSKHSSIGFAAIVLASKYDHKTRSYTVQLECPVQQLLVCCRVKELAELKNAEVLLTPMLTRILSQYYQAKSFASDMEEGCLGVCRGLDKTTRALMLGMLYLPIEKMDSHNEDSADSGTETASTHDTISGDDSGVGGKSQALIPTWLTEDQKSVLQAVCDRSNVCILVNAHAGAGKTTTITEAAKLITRIRPEEIPLITSETNAAVIHAAVTLNAKNDSDPLIFLSETAKRNLTATNKLQGFDRCTLSSHFRRLSKIVDTQADRELIRDAIKIERQMLKKLEESVMKSKDAQDVLSNLSNVEHLLLNDGEVDNVAVDSSYDAQVEKEKHQEEWRRFRDALRLLFNVKPPTVIMCTVATAITYSSLFNNQTQTVFIDEASTVSQIQMMLFFKFFSKTKQLVMVGDPLQLGAHTRDVPPSIKRFGFSSALDIVLTNEGSGVKHVSLTTNFRTHPAILDMMKEVVYPTDPLISFHQPKDRGGFPKPGIPIRWLQVAGNDELFFPTSRVNHEHSKAVLQVVKRLLKKIDHTHTIGIICLYNGQRDSLQEKMSHGMFLKHAARISVCSVDSYQGRESDYIILVTTLIADARKNPFFMDRERFNVAITRAKRGLVVIGNAPTLSVTKPWNLLHDFCKTRYLITTVDEFCL